MKSLRNVTLCTYTINKKETLGWLDESVVYEKLTNQTFCCQLSQLATAPGNSSRLTIAAEGDLLCLTTTKWATICWKALSFKTAATAPIHTNPHQHLQQQLASESLLEFPPSVSSARSSSSAVSSYFQALNPEGLQQKTRTKPEVLRKEQTKFLSQKWITFLSGGN